MTTPSFCMRVQVQINNGPVISDVSYEMDSDKGSECLSHVLQGRNVERVHLSSTAIRALNLCLFNKDMEFFRYQVPTMTNDSLVTFTILNLGGMRDGALRLFTGPEDTNKPVFIREGSYVCWSPESSCVRGKRFIPQRDYIDGFFAKSNLIFFDYKCESSAFVTTLDKLDSKRLKKKSPLNPLSRSSAA